MPWSHGAPPQHHSLCRERGVGCVGADLEARCSSWLHHSTFFTNSATLTTLWCVNNNNTTNVCSFPSIVYIIVSLSRRLCFNDVTLKLHGRIRDTSRYIFTSKTQLSIFSDSAINICNIISGVLGTAAVSPMPQINKNTYKHKWTPTVIGPDSVWPYLKQNLLRRC